MKIKLSTIILLLFFCFDSVYTQSVTPSQLKRKRKILYERVNNKPYTGLLDGVLSIRESINIANCRILLPIMNEWIMYGHDGIPASKLHLVGQIEQGKEIGKWYYYYINDHILLAEANFINGLWDGPLTIYYSDGKIEAINEYKAGKLNGISVGYDKQGNITGKSLYKEGIFIRKLTNETPLSPP